MAMHALPLLIIVLLLAGCGTSRTEAPAPDIPPALRHWPAQSNPQGVILGLHSFGDHGDAFALIAPCLNSAGYHLYSYDQAGFGLRQQQGRWAGERQLVGDASHLAQTLSEKHNMPVYLLGESLGGAVAILASLEAPEAVAGLILAAPAVREGIRLRYGWNALIAAGAAIWPGYRFQVERQPDDPALAPQAAQRLATDPKVMRQVRLDSYWGLIQIADRASDQAPLVTHPSLLLYGGQDQAVPQVGIERLHRHLSAAQPPDHRYHFYPDGPHFLLQGHNWQQVCMDINRWLQL